MSEAGPGEIHVADPVRVAAGDAFTWQALPSFVPKGKSEPVVPHALLGATGRAPPGRSAIGCPCSAAPTSSRTSGGGSTRQSGARGGSSGSPPRRGSASRGSSPSSSARPAAAASSWRSGSARPTERRRATSRGARSGARSSVSRTTARRTPRSRTSRRSFSAIDPDLVPRAPLLGQLVGLTLPDNDAHRRARREAPQGIARGSPRHVPARTSHAPAARPRARGLPLARRALPRPARRGLARDREPSACSSCSPTDRARTWATRSASRRSRSSTS